MHQKSMLLWHRDSLRLCKPEVGRGGPILVTSLQSYGPKLWPVRMSDDLLPLEELLQVPELPGHEQDADNQRPNAEPRHPRVGRLCRQQHRQTREPPVAVVVPPGVLSRQFLPVTMPPHSVKSLLHPMYVGYAIQLANRKAGD